MRSVVVAFLALGLASPTAAKISQVQPGRFLCSTAAGNFARQDILPLQPEQELRVAFKLLKENFHPQYTVLAAIFLEGPGGSTRVAVGKALNDRSHMYTAVRLPGSEAQRVSYKYPITNKWIVLTLKLDRRGFLHVRAHDRSSKFKLGKSPITKTTLHCHSGEFEIDISPPTYAQPPAAAASPPVKSN